MDGWEIALLVIAAYVAVTSLVRLMARHRDQMLDGLRDRMKAEKQRKQAAENQDQQDQYEQPPKAA